MKDCLDKFNKNLASLSDDKIIEFTRKNIIHGTPFIFASNEDKFYDFRKAIADKWNIIYHEIYITGSAKLGFSFFKNKLFDNDSDIDVAIISNSLFDRIAKEVEDFQWNIRNNNIKISYEELREYHKFLKYMAIGWIRPDKLPTLIRNDNNYLRDEWFEFFKELSRGDYNIGDYDIAAGVFKSYFHFERYVINGVSSCNQRLKNNF